MKIKKSPLKTLGLIGLALLTASGGVLAFQKLNSPDHTPTATQETEGTDEIGQNDINYNPPSNEEKVAADTKKTGEAQELSAPPSNAQVIITDASQYGNEIEVRALVSNIIQDGNCTITFKKNSTTITKTTPALADASTTQCRTLTVPRAEFPTAGTWNVTVEFASTTATGSKSQNMEVK